MPREKKLSFAECLNTLEKVKEKLTPEMIDVATQTEPSKNERLTELEKIVKDLQEENQFLKTQILQPVSKVNNYTQTETKTQDQEVQIETLIEYPIPGAWPKNIK